MAQPGSASMQGASGALGGGAEDTGRQEPLFREGDTVDTVLAKMTLAEKVGQMFIVRCPEQGAAEKAAEYHLGGYILFRENFEEKTPVQAAEMVRACQAAAALPMLVGEFCAGVRRKHGPGGFHLQKELWPERGRDGAVCAHRGGDDG